MVPVTLKMIVSPGEEMVILSRSDPDPLSDRLVTVRVAAVPSAGRSSSARRGQARRRCTASASSVGLALCRSGEVEVFIVTKCGWVSESGLVFVCIEQFILSTPS